MFVILICYSKNTLHFFFFLQVVGADVFITIWEPFPPEMQSFMKCQARQQPFPFAVTAHREMHTNYNYAQIKLYENNCMRQGNKVILQRNDF